MPNLDQLIKNILESKSEEIANRGRHKEGRIRVYTNDFDARSHADFVRDRWSGLRANNFAMRFEIWLLGRIHAELYYSNFFADPSSLNRMYTEAFGLETELDEQTHGAVIEVEARKAIEFKREELLKGKKL